MFQRNDLNIILDTTIEVLRFKKPSFRKLLFTMIKVTFKLSFTHFENKR